MSPSDTALLERWHDRRDANAFREIATRHSPMVFGACLRILRNRADAQEVSQEVFLRLSRGDVHIKASLSGWLHTLATRRSLDRIREEQNRRIRERRYSDVQTTTVEASWDDIQLFIDEAIAQLPEELRIPLVDHFLENRTHEEIALELGLTRSAVTRRVAKALEELRRTLRRRGVSTSAAGLTASLGKYAVNEVPVELTRSIGRMAVSGLGQTGQSGLSAAVTAAGGVEAMTKLKLLAIVALVLLTAGSGWLLLSENAPESAEVPSGLPESTRFAESTAPETDISPPELQDSDEQAISNANQESYRIAAALETGLMEASSKPTELMPAAPSGPVVGKVCGWVIDSDAIPINGAMVMALGEGLQGDTSTNEQGLFEVELRAEADSNAQAANAETLVFVSASRDGYVKATQTRIPLGTTDVELVLTREAHIQGWVVDGVTGKPVPKFEARISRHVTPVEGPQPTGDAWTAFSSEDGEFVLPTSLAATELDARAEGYGWTKKEVVLKQGESLEGVLIELQPGATIRGIVLDRATRQPVENAWVGIAIGQNATWRLQNRDEYDAQTGPDGRFEIAGAATQEFVDLKIWRDDYAPEFVIGHNMRSSGEITVLLSQGGRLRGQVTQNGTPVSGLRIHVRQAFGRPHVTNVTPPETPSFLTWTGTDDQGRYEFTRLAYGRYILRIIDPSPNLPLRERYLVRMWVDIGEGETVELHHEIAAYGSVCGQLAGLQNYDGVSVSICDVRYPNEPMYMTGEKHDANGPDESGAFAFGPVEAGDYIARVHLPGTPGRILEQPCTVSPGASTELLFQIEESAPPEAAGETQVEGS